MATTEFKPPRARGQGELRHAARASNHPLFAPEAICAFQSPHSCHRTNRSQRSLFCGSDLDRDSHAGAFRLTLPWLLRTAQLVSQPLRQALGTPIQPPCRHPERQPGAGFDETPGREQPP